MHFSAPITVTLLVNPESTLTLHPQNTKPVHPQSSQNGRLKKKRKLLPNFTIRRQQWTKSERPKIITQEVRNFEAAQRETVDFIGDQAKRITAWLESLNSSAISTRQSGAITYSNE